MREFLSDYFYSVTRCFNYGDEDDDDSVFQRLDYIQFDGGQFIQYVKDGIGKYHRYYGTLNDGDVVIGYIHWDYPGSGMEDRHYIEFNNLPENEKGVKAIFVELMKESNHSFLWFHDDRPVVILENWLCGRKTSEYSEVLGGVYEIVDFVFNWSNK